MTVPRPLVARAAAVNVRLEAAAILATLPPDPDAAEHREELRLNLYAELHTCIVIGCHTPIERLGFCTRHRGVFTQRRVA